MCKDCADQRINSSERPPTTKSRRSSRQLLTHKRQAYSHPPNHFPPRHAQRAKDLSFRCSLVLFSTHSASVSQVISRSPSTPVGCVVNTGDTSPSTASRPGSSSLASADAPPCTSFRFALAFAPIHPFPPSSSPASTRAAPPSAPSPLSLASVALPVRVVSRCTLPPRAHLVSPAMRLLASTIALIDVALFCCLYSIGEYYIVYINIFVTMLAMIELYSACIELS
jgi:hypothetical protein